MAKKNQIRRQSLKGIYQTILRFFKERNHTFCNRIDQCNFAVYLLLAFTSFFFTGAADQSILDNQQPGELMQTANHVKITPEHAVHNLPNSL